MGVEKKMELNEEEEEMKQEGKKTEDVRGSIFITRFYIKSRRRYRYKV